MKIGFIGLGNMGAPMARNLLKAGHELIVFDIAAAAVQEAAGLGASAAESSQAVARADVDLVMTMLPASAQVEAVYLGAGGILTAVNRGVLLIDSSTIDPLTSRKVAAEAARQGNPMLDAPVSGGTAGAQAATLTFMVGGEVSAFDAAKPVLASMGRNVVHCGGSGNGQVAKIANNLLLGISMIGVAEAMTLGVALGMEPRLLASVINSSSGRCWSCDTYNPYPGVLEGAPASRGYTGGFAAALMLKDLGLACDAAQQAGQPVVLGAVAQQLYQMFANRGRGRLDFSAIIESYRRAAPQNG
jgi:3-hydroxyisobutyrate dehydrogenase